jgi:predicted patatin/cPLA2 family phospholipase
MQAFNQQSTPFHIVTIDVTTSSPVYTLGTESNLESILTQPVAYRTPIRFEGRKMMDGGVADSIPVC